MLYEEDVVVGLDVGTTKVVAMIGVAAESGQVRILGWGNVPSFGVQNGEVVNGRQVAESIQKAMQIAIGMAQSKTDAELQIREVYVGIAGKHIRVNKERASRFCHDQMISEEILKEMESKIWDVRVRAGENVIQVEPQCYMMDDYCFYHKKDVIGALGKEIKVDYQVVTADTEAIRRIRRSVEMSGLEVAGFVLEPLASSATVLDESDRELGTILVDMGGGTTDLAVFLENELVWVDIIPFAGNAITSDIQEMGGISAWEAENLKVKHGNIISDQNSIYVIPGGRGRAPKEIESHRLSMCIRARVDEILGLVKNSISTYCTSTDAIWGGLVLTGGGANLQGIADYLQQQLDINVRIGCNTERLVEEGVEELNDPIYATSIGLLLYGIAYEGRKL